MFTLLKLDFLFEWASSLKSLVWFNHGGVHTKIRDPGSSGGPDFQEKNPDFQIGIDTKFEGGCRKCYDLGIFSCDHRWY